MTPGDRGRKVLAIAIMRDGRVVGKLIPGKKPVRLGVGYDNNIVVDAEEIPESMVLISPGDDPGTWLLRLTDNMDAVIRSADGTTLKFSDLKELGIFPIDSEGFHLLNIKYLDQGQVEVGPFMIHFGFIVPPKSKAVPPEKREEKKPGSEEKKDDRVLKVVVESPAGKEELFPEAGLLTVGKAGRNTVTVKGGGLPRVHTLLEPSDGDKYVMRLVPGIKGGVEVNGSVVPFHTLMERGLMKREKPDGPYIWVLDKNVSGVFTLGDKEIFFSFVEPEVVRKEKKAAEEVTGKPGGKYVAPSYDRRRFTTRPHERLVINEGARAENNRMAVILSLGLAASLLTGVMLDRFVTVARETREQKLRSAPTARVVTLIGRNRPIREVGGEEKVADMGIGGETVVVRRSVRVSFSISSSDAQVGIRGRTMDDMRRKMDMLREKLEMAYENLLRTDPTAGGTIDVSFSITPDGSVVDVVVSAGDGPASLEAAVRAAVQSLNFGPSDEQTNNIPVTVSIDLALSG